MALLIILLLALALGSCGQGDGLGSGGGSGGPGPDGDGQEAGSGDGPRGGQGGALDQDTPITIFVASDIHYMSKELYDGGEAFKKYMESSNGRNFLYIDEVVRAFAYEAEGQKPDALVISGDLTNNGEKTNHLALAERLRELEENSGTKVYIIPGNHDIDNPWARKFVKKKMKEVESVIPEEFAEIYHEFGYGEAISRDEFTLSYLVAPSESLWILMLDTNLYRSNRQNDSPTVGGALFEETLEWIEECTNLAREKGAEIITVSHHNLLKHSENRYFGYTISQNERALEVYEKLNILLNLSGHIHAQSIKSQDFENGTFYDIVTGTMSSYPARYGVLKYYPGKEFTYDTFSVDVETWAKDKGETDPNLLDFNNYSKNLYLAFAYERYYSNLVKEGKYSEREMDEMAKTMSLVNALRFAGLSEGDDHLIDEIKASPGYDLWLKEGTNFSDLPKYKNTVIMSLI